MVVGLGGVGSALVEPLARFMEFNQGPKELLLIDGDVYEEKNLHRQNIGLGDLDMAKAEVHANRLQAFSRTIKTGSRSSFLDSRNVERVIQNGDVVFACVDNHATRRLLQERCMELENAVLISGGNELVDGNVQIYIRRNNKDMCVPIYEKHPEIEFPDDDLPTEAACGVLAAEGQEQIIFTNLTVATLMLNAYHSLMKGDLPYTEVMFNIERNTVRAVKRERSGSADTGAGRR